MTDLIMGAWLLSVAPVVWLSLRGTRSMRGWQRWVAVVFLVLVTWLGLLMVAGVFIPTDTDPGTGALGVMGALGVLFCLPLAWLNWRGRSVVNAPDVPRGAEPKGLLAGFRDGMKDAQAKAKAKAAAARPPAHGPAPAPASDDEDADELWAQLVADGIEDEADASESVSCLFTYRKPNGEPEERFVSFDSHSYFGENDALYLNGTDFDRDLEQRSFKASRIMGLMTELATGEMLRAEALALRLPEVEPPFGDDRW